MPQRDKSKVCFKKFSENDVEILENLCLRGQEARGDRELGSITGLRKSCAVSEFSLLSGCPPPIGWVWTAPPGSLLPFSFPQTSLHNPHSPMETDAKALGCPLDPCSRAGDRAGHTGALGGSGSYHGIIVAVHHEGAPASEVDVLFPPVTHLWVVRL